MLGIVIGAMEEAREEERERKRREEAGDQASLVSLIEDVRAQMKVVESEVRILSGRSVGVVPGRPSE